MKKQYKLSYLSLFYTAMGLSTYENENKTEPFYLWKQKQTFGIQLYLKYYNSGFFLEQRDINNQINTKGTFSNKIGILKTLNNKQELIKIFNLRRQYGNCLQNIEIFLNKNGTLQVNTKNNKETKEVHQSNNIYNLLDNIMTLNLRDNTSPDYYKRANDIIFTKKDVDYLYKIYYAFHHQYRIYNSMTYINEQVNITMGSILSSFGVPAMYFHSGNGDEIFVYLGVHICGAEGVKQVYYGILIMSFDIFNICRSIVYIMDKCPKCHSNIMTPHRTEDNKYFFRIDNNYETNS